MSRLKRLGRDLVRAAWSTDWFDWFLLGSYVLFGVLGGVVASLITKEFN